MVMDPALTTTGRAHGVAGAKFTLRTWNTPVGKSSVAPASATRRWLYWVNQELDLPREGERGVKAIRLVSPRCGTGFGSPVAQAFTSLTAVP